MSLCADDMTSHTEHPKDAPKLSELLSELREAAGYKPANK